MEQKAININIIHKDDLESEVRIRGAKHDCVSSLRAKVLNKDLPPDYDYRLMQEIRNRTQGSDENIVIYLSKMHNYFSRLSKPISEDEKLSIILFNIRPFYTTQLALHPAESLDDLQRKCRLLEHARERARLFREPPKKTQDSVAPDLCYKPDSGKPRPIGAIKPVYGNFCVRCRVDGHSLKRCQAPFALVCYRCGAKDVTVRTCARCSRD